MHEESREFRAQIDARETLKSIGNVTDEALNTLVQGNAMAALLRTKTIRAQLDDVEKLLVANLYGNQHYGTKSAGLSWTDIGGLLGISKQSAQTKFSNFVRLY
jgi:hypothetical protein